jgi:hypothetical protein
MIKYVKNDTVKCIEIQTKKKIHKIGFVFKTKKYQKHKMLSIDFRNPFTHVFQIHVYNFSYANKTKEA